MAAQQTPLRRGLPRVAGGEPWPPAGAVVELEVPEEVVAPAAVSADTTAGLSAVPLRRGLPRVPGGEPFPPAAQVLLPVPADAGQPQPVEQAISAEPQVVETARPVVPEQTVAAETRQRPRDVATQRPART